MKTIITKFFAIALSVLLLSTSYTFATDTSASGGYSTSGSVYNYTNFAASGNFTSIKNSDNSETRLYANARVTGYYGSAGAWNQTSKTTMSGNGTASSTEDNYGNISVYDASGNLTKQITTLSNAYVNENVTQLLAAMAVYDNTNPNAGGTVLTLADSSTGGSTEIGITVANGIVTTVTTKKDKSGTVIKQQDPNNANATVDSITTTSSVVDAQSSSANDLATFLLSVRNSDGSSPLGVTNAAALTTLLNGLNTALSGTDGSGGYNAAIRSAFYNTTTDGVITSAKTLTEAQKDKYRSGFAKGYTQAQVDAMTQTQIDAAPGNTGCLYLARTNLIAWEKTAGNIPSTISGTVQNVASVQTGEIVYDADGAYKVYTRGSLLETNTAQGQYSTGAAFTYNKLVEGGKTVPTTVSYNSFDRDGRILGSYSYEYDPSGTVASDFKKLAVAKTVYNYDSANRLTDVTSTNDGNKVTSVTNYVNGQKTQTRDFAWVLPNGESANADDATNLVNAKQILTNTTTFNYGGTRLVSSVSSEVDYYKKNNDGTYVMTTGTNPTKVYNFDTDGVTLKTTGTAVTKTTYYDAHGRVTSVVEPDGTASDGTKTSKSTTYSYNDTGKTITNSVGIYTRGQDNFAASRFVNYSVEVVAGGCLESTTKNTTTTTAGVATTQEFKSIFIDGNQQLPYVTDVLVSDEYRLDKAVSAAAAPDVWTSWGDPTVRGNLTVSNDGNVSLTVTNASQFQNMVAGLDAAVSSNQQWAQKGLDTYNSKHSSQIGLNSSGHLYYIFGQTQVPLTAAQENTVYSDTTSNPWANSLQNGARLRQLKTSIVSSWTSSGGTFASNTASGTGSVSMRVGAIDSTSASLGQSNGHAASVAYSSVKDGKLMNSITDMRSGVGTGSATLSWDYWSISSTGQVWLFANSAS